MSVPRTGGTTKIPVRRVAWKPCFRIIPSRFPTVPLFERVADPADLDAVLAVESLTNDRLRQEAGKISLVSPGDRVTGSGASYIMAAFTHPAPVGGRFTDGSFGAYYAAHDEATAIAETRYHRERFMSATQQPAMELQMRVLIARLDGDLHDIRGRRSALPTIYDANSYEASQHLARALRSTGSWGIAHDSVRHAGGECAAILRPPVLSHCRQGRHFIYQWDGERIDAVFRKSLHVNS
ncbi:MAG: RES family NAD+ phosphorylase [Gemmatimonadaceae bacterium]